MGRKKNQRKNKKRRNKASSSGVPSVGATSGPGMAHFNEKWLRLALVIHEAPTAALKSVLDNAISTKHAHLNNKSFEQKLEISLKTDETPLSKAKKKFLLDYEVPTVFLKSGCPGTYDMFDVGIVCRLIKYFVGKADFDKETASLPRKPVPGTNQQNIDFEKLGSAYLSSASELALVEVIREYRNFVFHHTGSPVLSLDDFNHHWDNLVLALERLGYDVGKVSGYRSGPLDYNGKLVVSTIEELLKEAMRSMREELASKKDVNELRLLLIDEVEWIGRLLGKFQADMQKVENVLNEVKELLPEMAKKEELHELKDMLHPMIATFCVVEEKLDVHEDKLEVLDEKLVVQVEMLEIHAEKLNVHDKKLDVYEDKLEVRDEKLDVHHDKIRNIEQKLNGAGELTGIQNADKASLEERKQRAQEACKSAHERLLKLRELDIFGDPKEGVRKSDLMVSLTNVECRDLDTSRLESAYEIRDLLTGYSANLKTVAMQALLKTDELVLLRGYPRAGKSTLAHLILKEWNAGRLWSDQYDLIFYVHAPRLATLLNEQPFNTERVLAVLYPDVLMHLSYKELKMFKCLIMVDAIDECDIEKICAPDLNGSFEEAINNIITSSESKFHRIILGRPSACDSVRRNLLQNINFEFVEVIGFTLEQVKEYVYKFCLHDKSKSENLWQRISDNNSLLAMSHLPILANVICNVLSENVNVEIKTETDLYVWSYFVLLTRHRIRKDGDKLKPSTFEELFNEESLIVELLKVSKIAYEKLSKCEIFFSARDFDLAGMGTTFVSPFILRYERYLSFSHLTQMEFFAAVHLFITSYESLDKKILEMKHFQRVIAVLFGLLGGAVTNSDSAQIVRFFVQPLMERIKMKPLEKHPLCGEIAKSLFGLDGFHYWYLHVCFQFQNSLLLKAKNFLLADVCKGELSLSFNVRQHHQLDHITFFMEHVNFEARSVVLVIAPFDGQFSEVECWKLRYLIESRVRNIDYLALNGFAISDEKMEILAPALVLVPIVWLFRLQISEESWNILLLAVRNSDADQTRRPKGLFYELSCDIPLAISDELRRRNSKCRDAMHGNTSVETL